MLKTVECFACSSELQVFYFFIVCCIKICQEKNDTEEERNVLAQKQNNCISCNTNGMVLLHIIL